MASSRRLPTSYNESTYGNATRDYTSLALWESDTDINLVTATTGKVFTCYNDSAPYSDSVNITGATTNSSYFRVIRGATGHEGTPASGVRFTASGAAVHVKTIAINENYAQVHDIAAKATVTATSGVYIAIAFQAQNSSDNIFVGCIAYDTTSASSTGGFRGIALISSGNSKAINCVAKDCSGGNYASRGGIIVYSSTGQTSYVYNCTSVGNNIGLKVYNITCNSKNCIIQGNTTNISQSGGTHNQTTNVTSGMTFDTDGIHLTGSDGNGTNLSSDSVFAFDDDLDKDTISGSWDRGADFYVSASATASTDIDALIQDSGLTQSTSINALIQQQALSTANLDAVLCQAQIKELVLDALIQSHGTASAAIDALLQDSGQAQSSINAILQSGSATTKATSLDAALQKKNVSTFLMDALIQKSDAANVVLDALIQSPDSKTLVIDAVLQRSDTKAVFLDAALQQVRSSSAILDSMIQTGNQVSAVLDAIMTGSGQSTTSMDSVLTMGVFAGLFLDAIIQTDGYTAVQAIDYVDSIAQKNTVSVPAQVRDVDVGKQNSTIN